MNESVISPVDFYECETESLTLIEEHRLRVVQNCFLRQYMDQ